MNQKERLSSQGKIAEIRLLGIPYHREVDGEIVDCTDVLERLATNENYKQKLRLAINENEENLQPLFEGGYYGVDRKIKKGESLTYEDAFSLMSFVLMASNSQIRSELSPRIKIGDTSLETITLQGIALLAELSAKEAYVGLTPEEIAGLTAATLELDTVVRVDGGQQAFGVGGMGGDRGYPRNGDRSKLFSLSTMGAAVLACFGNVHKHHSYPNTSKIAGQTAIEAIGGRSDQDSQSAMEVLQHETNLFMSSCHTVRTLHTISHRLKGETINHVVGPLAIPVSKDTTLNAFIGVNDNVHPETIIRSLQILQKNGIQKYGNSVAFCGLLKSNSSHFSEQGYYQDKEAKNNVAIDEVAPPPHDTLAAFLVEGQNLGTFIITPSDFLDDDLIAHVDFHGLLIPNTAEGILQANNDAIIGQDLPKSIYLAMTVALGIFTRDYSHLKGAFDQKNRRVNQQMLRKSFYLAFEKIAGGDASAKLQEYIIMSNEVLNI